MTDSAEIAAWLTRFERRFGVDETRLSLQKLSLARELFFEEIGYDITRRQFEALSEQNNQKVQQEILAEVRAETGKERVDKKGRVYYQTNYRDLRTGRFTKRPQ